MQIAVLGIDLGKDRCIVVGLDGDRRVLPHRRMRRKGIVKLAAGLPEGFEDYDTIHPHSGFHMQSPREFITQRPYTPAECPV